MERLYQHRPWMSELMFVIGSKPRSVGEGVVVEAYTLSYEIAYNHWQNNPHHDWAIYQYREGSLRHVGRRMRNPKSGLVFYVPIPPTHLATG